MSTKEVVCALRDDKQELQKQLGCMNGIFQIFDRRYLLGQRRHGHNQKRLPPGQNGNGDKDISNASEQVKEKTLKVVMKEKQRVSVESSRNSFSSSSSSTALSSLDCSKRVQTEKFSSCQSVISEPSSSPSLHRKKPDFFIHSPDIRDVVKDSMTREPRVVSIKTVAKDERAGPMMKHIDSPRPFPDQKSIQRYGNDQNLQWAVKEVKETSRFSCDGRESRYLSKSNMKVKELPRLSLDSRKSYISKSADDPRRSLLIREIKGGGDMETLVKVPSNKRPSSSVVARLMGLEALTASIDESEKSRSSRKEEEVKHNCTFVSPRVRKDLVSHQRGVGHVITRIPLETAPWKQECSGRGSQKPLFKNNEGPARTKTASPSIYGEIEKRLTEHEYKTAGKDLRALKQILEAMQKTRSRLENKEHASDNSNSSTDYCQSQKSHQPVSPSPPRRHEILKMDTKSAKRTSDSRKDLAGRQSLKDQAPRDKRATGGNVSPRMQKSKNGVETVDKPSIHGPSSALCRIKKQPGIQRTQLGSMTRNPKAKNMDTLQDRVQPLGYSDMVSFQSESNSLASQNDSEVTSTESIQEVNSAFQPKENQKSNIEERLTQDKSMAEYGKHTEEQPSPVSVLDAFYAEGTPSPVKKKSIAFSDDENIHFKEAHDQAQINNLANSTNQDQYSKFNVKLENIKNLVHQIELLNINGCDATIDHTATSPSESETGDHNYVSEIVLASGFLKDLARTTTIVQLHPTGSLINPQLFYVLEKTKGCTEFTYDGYSRKNMRSKSNEIIRRKLVFDTVNDVLGHKLAMLGPFGTRAKGRILNGDKLLKELCSGIDSLQNNSERGIYDEDDGVIYIINADVNKRSQDWDEFCYEVPGLVLDIERLIFKDLISEVVTGLQDRPATHCRQLFPM